jgi:hypothetical protein
MSEHPGSDCAGGGAARLRPGGAAGPAAAGTRAPGRCWLVPGGQPGPPAAVLSCVSGGRIGPPRLAACPRTRPAARPASAAAVGRRPGALAVRTPVSSVSAAGPRPVPADAAAAVWARCDAGPGAWRSPGGAGRRRGRRDAGMVRARLSAALWPPWPVSGRRPGRRRPAARHRPRACEGGWSGLGILAPSHVWVCRCRCGPVRRSVRLVTEGPGIPRTAPGNPRKQADTAPREGPRRTCQCRCREPLVPTGV